MSKENYNLHDKGTQSANDQKFRDSIGPYFESSQGTVISKLENFARFVPRQTLAFFLAKNALFEKILNVQGSIVECGVFMGGGLFTWAQLSAIHEPINHNRKIVGFDSFNGFPSIGVSDFSPAKNSNIVHKKAGGYRFDGKAEIDAGIALYDLNRPVGHISKVEIVKGDALVTMPEFLLKNPHLVVSMLYLDFDLYEPTKLAIQTFLPRMPKGAILVFDELNQSQWPGETLAVLEEVGLRNLAIKRFSFTPALSYAILD